MHKSR